MRYEREYNEQMLPSCQIIRAIDNDPINIEREIVKEGDSNQRFPWETTLRGPGPDGAIGEAVLHEKAALSTEGRGPLPMAPGSAWEHQCNHKRASWSLHPLRAYGSPQGYRYRTPGAWGGRKPRQLKMDSKSHRSRY